MSHFMSVTQLAARWNVDRLQIYNAIHSGRLRQMRLAKRGKFRIPIAEVERFERGEFLPKPMWS